MAAEEKGLEDWNSGLSTGRLKRQEKVTGGDCKHGGTENRSDRDLGFRKGARTGLEGVTVLVRTLFRGPSHRPPLLTPSHGSGWNPVGIPQSAASSRLDMDLCLIFFQCV